MDHQRIDGVRNKRVSKKKRKKNKKIQLAWKILRDLYRSPLIGKLHSQKEIYLCFKVASSGTCLVFASFHGSSIFAIKSHGSRVSTFLSPKHNYESIIVILSVTCIVPKYHIVFCMIVMFLTLSSYFQSPLKLQRSFCIYVFLHSWRLAR